MLDVRALLSQACMTKNEKKKNSKASLHYTRKGMKTLPRTTITVMRPPISNETCVSSNVF